jgi:hypothetical protein
MAITAAICNSFKQEILQGVHEAADTYKIALYTSSATLSKDTTAYTATGEASGTGYTAGGEDLAGFSVSLDGDTAILDFTTNPSWADATITARGALIYNSTQANKAVAVLDFGSDISSTAGTFTVTLPAPTSAAGLIRIA